MEGSSEVRSVYPIREDQDVVARGEVSVSMGVVYCFLKGLS